MRAAFASSLVLAAIATRVSRTQKGRKSQCGVLGAAASNETSISIVNGDDAPECKWRWQVGIIRNEGEMPFCGGTLIEDNWVLTAAHCVAYTESKYKITAGDWKPRLSSTNRQVRDVEAFYWHPMFNQLSKNFDVALLKLASPVEINSCVGTACLPEEGSDVGEESCWVTGWGVLQSGGRPPTVLQEGQVDTLTLEQCRNRGYWGWQVKDEMLCSQGKTEDGSIIDACQGDSGGPLVCERDGAWRVYGATSWGRGCARERYPGISVRVHVFLDWIQRTMDRHA